METVEVERIPAMDSLRRFTSIIGSSYGLLCVILGYEKDDPPPSLLLLNPATKEVRQVPRSTNDDGRYCRSDWGFGYSPVVRDYKIVTIHRAWIYKQINLGFIRVARVEVFSLRTGSWKEVEFGVIRSVILQSKSVNVNGAIFWLGLEAEDRRGLLVSFDLATEVFTLIPIPSSTSITPIHKIVLDVYENKVAMLHRYYAHECKFIDLWVLEEGSGAYGKSWSWTKKYSIRSTSRFLCPKCLWRNEIVWYNFIDKSVFLFNLTTNNELKKLHSSLSDHDMIMARSFFYVESLVSMYDTYVE